MSNSRRLALHILISLAVGGAVFVVACLAAWQSCRSSPAFRLEQFTTRFRILDIGKAIEDYRKEKGALPTDLTQLNEHIRLSRGPIVDGWGRPFLYSVEGEQYTVTSYGQDGKPGGIGFDADLSSGRRTLGPSLPTFAQFLAVPRTEGVITVCAVSAVLACLLTLVLVNLPTPAPGSVGQMIGRVAIAGVATVVTAVVICGFHFTTGH